MNEWIIIAIVAVVLLFSAKKLPDMARGLGQSMRIFKAETRGMREDEQTVRQGADTQPPAGEVAPGRAAAEGAGNATPQGNGTAGTAGTADGAPRAGS